MGMYTEVVIKVRTKDLDELSDSEIGVLRFMFNDEDMPEELPDHPFFHKERWTAVGKCSSFYHHPNTVNSFYQASFMNDIAIYSRSDFKSYDNEAEAFLDWLPSVASGVAYKWYEEDEWPTWVKI